VKLRLVGATLSWPAVVPEPERDIETVSLLVAMRWELAEEELLNLVASRRTCGADIDGLVVKEILPV
jgi:hypothetical protein